MVWAGTFTEKEGSPELRAELEAAMRELGAGADLELWVNTATELLTLARRAEGKLAKRLARLDGLELTVDLLSHERTAKARKVDKDLRCLEAHSLASFPREWQGKRYKRLEAHHSEDQRASAEAAGRKR